MKSLLNIKKRQKYFKINIHKDFAVNIKWKIMFIMDARPICKYLAGISFKDFTTYSTPKHYKNNDLKKLIIKVYLKRCQKLF